MDSLAEESENTFQFNENECNKTNCNTFKNGSEHSNNIVHKLFNREIYGSTSRKSNDRSRKMFDKIPPRLRFCLMDIVPISYLRKHVFMGFSQCGQFLLSFTYSCNNQVYFRESSKFKLHFLSWVPGKVVRPVHSVPLFGDDCVDSKVTISMAQWKHNPGVLVVYGIAFSCSERSYLSVIGVPRLGCKKCAAYSKEEDDAHWGKRCLEHNFAIHTKFFCTSDSSMYEPVVQLAYSNQIIIYTDFIHILEIDFVDPDQDRNETNDYNKFALDRDDINSMDTNPSTPASDVSAPFQSPKYQNNVVQNILADFSDLEAEPYQMSRPVHLSDMMGQELCIQASSISHNLVEEWEGPSPSIRTLISPPLRSPRRRPAESMSRFNETHRTIAEKAYEFVEETDTKCEKLSIFRKRRLADKKYEFSEDNNENIVPFRVLRSNRKYFIGSASKSQTKRAKSPPTESVVLRAHNQISRPTSPTTSCDLKNPGLSALESDRNSESEYRVMEMLDDGSLKTVAVHDNTSKTLSDIPVSPQDPYLVHSENSKCSKFFTRYFVESDDEITSIITDSEDDCMSGYHVALHLTAHGARYVPLQAVSAGAWERLPARRTVRATQRSLDTELLCNEVCGRLCHLQGIKFIYCFDWGCHVIDVCHSSGCLSGLCAMWLWASEEAGAGGAASECDACRTVSAGCLSHRRQYAAECLFVWDLVTGVYRTERVSMTEDDSQEGSRVSGAERARELAKRLGPINMPPGNENRLLTTLTGKSLKRLTDVDNCIEITKNHPDSSESESSSEEDSEYD
ncbi:PREDICTED: uncharacterized protein LOC106125310 [Papilio xuthus]|uniref:DDB1-and CUL4-associated factor 15 n=1 Tax=Papilio xuthus TaxID=66420 RepID=A0A194Q7Y8_PAPXU|nr:PREDICTED: uncharacterized protein LOC106125310 [Papilio xuthus]KPJ01638.1 DDB1- and CUL4-associated factor 15 [Papilio xuthus]